MAQKHTNPRAYEFADHRPRIKVEVEVVLDMVPGWGDKIEDHIGAIFNANPYVVSATVADEVTA